MIKVKFANPKSSVAYSKPCQISKMERFVKIVKGFPTDPGREIPVQSQYAFYGPMDDLTPLLLTLGRHFRGVLRTQSNI